MIVAGAIVVWVPDTFWQALFLAGGDGVTWLQRIENALVGPLVAVFSFVCSVGNVPMAAALFNGGISFGGALAFIYGDLIVIPMLLVYRQYYGTRLAVQLGVILYIAMALTGFHLFASFLWIAPSSTLREVIPGNLLSQYMIPMWGQSWSVFAPEPINGDYYFDVRAVVSTPDGGEETTDWVRATDVELDCTHE